MRLDLAKLCIKFSEIGRKDPAMERNRDGDLRNFMHECKL